MNEKDTEQARKALKWISEKYNISKPPNLKVTTEIPRIASLSEFRGMSSLIESRFGLVNGEPTIFVSSWLDSPNWGNVLFAAVFYGFHEFLDWVHSGKPNHETTHPPSATIRKLALEDLATFDRWLEGQMEPKIEA